MRLNSVQLEADLRREPEMPNTGVCILYVTHLAYNSDEPSNFEVHVHGKQAKACMDKLKRRDGVRIVGRLRSAPARTEWAPAAARSSSKPSMSRPCP